MKLDNVTRTAVMQMVEKKANVNWEPIKDYAMKGGLGGLAVGALKNLLPDDEELDGREKAKKTMMDMAQYGMLGGLGGAGLAAGRELIPGLGFDKPKEQTAPGLRGSIQDAGSLVSQAAQPAAAIQAGRGIAGDIQRNLVEQKAVKETLSDPKKLKALNESLAAGTGDMEFNNLVNKATGNDTFLGGGENKAAGTRFLSKQLETHGIDPNAERAFAEASKTPYHLLPPEQQKIYQKLLAQQLALDKNPALKKMYGLLDDVAAGSATPGTVPLAEPTTGFNKLNNIANDWAKRIAVNPNASNFAKRVAPVVSSNAATGIGGGLLTGTLMNYGGQGINYLARPDKLQ